MKQSMKLIRNYCIYNLIDVLVLIFDLVVYKDILWYEYLVLAGVVLNTIGILLNLSIIKKVEKIEKPIPEEM